MNTNNTTALTTPVRQDPPMSTRGGRGPAKDIVMAWNEIKDTEEEWFLVAKDVPNPNRYFDAFKALGGVVKQCKTTTGGTDVYVKVPEGGPKPHFKPSDHRSKKSETTDVTRAA